MWNLRPEIRHGNEKLMNMKRFSKRKVKIKMIRIPIFEIEARENLRLPLKLFKFEVLRFCLKEYLHSDLFHIDKMRSFRVRLFRIFSLTCTKVLRYV